MTGPEAKPVNCTRGTGSFSGVRRPQCDADHPPLSTAEDANGLQLYLRLPSMAACDDPHIHVFKKILNFCYGNFSTELEAIRRY